MRYLIEFSRTGAAAMMSHLDLQRGVQRALRRSGLPIGYSQGFNPHAALSFSAALSVGVRTVCDIIDVRISVNDPAEIMRRLDAAMPPGLHAIRARAVSDSFPAPMAAAVACDMRIEPAGALATAVDGFLSASTVMVDKKGKNGVTQVDIRPRVLSLCAESNALIAQVSCTQEAFLRPELLVSALAKMAGVEPPLFTATRTMLYAQSAGGLVPLMELPDGGAVHG